MTCPICGKDCGWEQDEDGVLCMRPFMRSQFAVFVVLVCIVGGLLVALIATLIKHGGHL